MSAPGLTVEQFMDDNFAELEAEFVKGRGASYLDDELSDLGDDPHFQDFVREKFEEAYS